MTQFLCQYNTSFFTVCVFYLSNEDLHVSCCKLRLFHNPVFTFTIDAERAGLKKKIFYLKLTTKVLGIAYGVIGTWV